MNAVPARPGLGSNEYLYPFRHWPAHVTVLAALTEHCEEAGIGEPDHAALKALLEDALVVESRHTVRLCVSRSGAEPLRPSLHAALDAALLRRVVRATLVDLGEPGADLFNRPRRTAPQADTPAEVSVAA